MTEHWKVENITYIFGGATTYQVSTDLTETILGRYVSEVERWMKKAESSAVKSGKIYQDELTHTLLDGVGGVTLGILSTSIEVILGHGGLLGGMDKKLIFTRIDKEQHDKLNALIEDFVRYDDLWNSAYFSLKGSDLERTFIPEADLEAYDAYIKAQRDEDELRTKTSVHRSTKDFFWLDPAHVIGLLKTDKRLTPEQLEAFPSNTKTLSDVSHINMKAVRDGFKQTVYKMKEINRIHYCPYPLPVIIVMNDGSQFMVAPQMLREDPPFVREVVAKVRQVRHDKEWELKAAFIGSS